MSLLTLVPLVHLLIVWWLFKGINQSSKPHISNSFSVLSAKLQTEETKAINLGIISSLIFFISFFLPFYNLGSKGVTLWYILTEVPNNDLIGIFVLFVGGIMLVANVDMNIIKTATIIGVCFPLYRFYKIVSVGDIGSSYLQPSFGIGGYLILIGAGIQLYACFSSTIEDDVIEKDILEPQKESNLKDNINTSNTNSTDNENSSDDITEKIEKLSQLKDKGVLTEKEFDDKKKELLDRI